MPVCDRSKRIPAGGRLGARKSGRAISTLGPAGSPETTAKRSRRRRRRRRREAAADIYSRDSKITGRAVARDLECTENCILLRRISPPPRRFFALSFFRFVGGHRELATIVNRPINTRASAWRFYFPPFSFFFLNVIQTRSTNCTSSISRGALGSAARAPGKRCAADVNLLMLTVWKCIALKRGTSGKPWRDLLTLPRRIFFFSDWCSFIPFYRNTYYIFS